MGNIYLLTLLFIVTISSNFNTNKAHVAHSLPYQTTQPPSPSPSHSHAPTPSPSHHHHHHHHAAHSPASAPPPSQPSKPVTPSPPPHVTAKAPTHAVKRQLVAVQGMVYCETNCSKVAAFNNTLFGAAPLPGARVVLRCMNTPYLLRKTATTDKNGYFFMEAPTTVTTYGAHKCKVYLSHRPTNNNGSNGVCSNATDLNNGVSGAYLFSNNTGPPKPLHAFSLFSVGPFAYVSATCA